MGLNYKGEKAERDKYHKLSMPQQKERKNGWNNN